MRASAGPAKTSPIMPREDIVPVIIGGDWSTYPIAREFHEAFGVRSACVLAYPVDIVAHSRLIQMELTPNMSDAEVALGIERVAERHPGKRLVLVANSDDRVEQAERLLPKLPASVVFGKAPHELVSRVSDKVRFQQLCESYGLDVPATEVVSLAGTRAPAPSAVPFPVVAKPAVSSEYVNLYLKGFKKVYFAREQAELDRLWADLRTAGFAGDFLVQELVPGDDTCKDNVIVYCGSDGRPSLLASATTIVEDHAPMYFGNAVTMLTRPMPELWERLARMLADIGWRGFASIDLKRDPRDGRRVFMDFNPRVGSNSYYVCAAGANPMYALVRDLVDGERDETSRAERETIYTRAPVSLARRYIRDADLLARFDELARARRVVSPLRMRGDSLRSQLMGRVMELNYVRKFHECYPEPTDTSF